MDQQDHSPDNRLRPCLKTAKKANKTSNADAEDFLQAIEFSSNSIATPSSKRCDSFTSSSEESTPGLTDCSSRSSFQDFDHLSIDDYEEFKDALEHIPATSAATAEGDPPAIACIPRILMPHPRTVSFSGVEEVYGEREVDISSSSASRPSSAYKVPKTPYTRWHTSSKHHEPISSHRMQKPPKVPIYSSSPLLTSPPAPFSTKNMFLPPDQQLQRRSTLKKSSKLRRHEEWCEAALIHPPRSPQLMWYGPKR